MVLLVAAIKHTVDVDDDAGCDGRFFVKLIFESVGILRGICRISTVERRSIYPYYEVESLVFS